MATWAEANFKLSPEYSAKTGLIELDPFQRDIFNAYSDPRVRQLTVMSGTQLVKTLVMQVGMAWAIVHDPGPMLFAGYKDDDVKKFSMERFSPMVRDNEFLHPLVQKHKSRDAGNTVDHKRFHLGAIDFVGSISPDNFARLTIKHFYCDEVDKWDNTGKEGDRIALGKARLARFKSRSKLVVACSPTLRGNSRVAKEFELSDQNHGYVACPHCKEHQILRWANVEFDSTLDPIGASKTARYICAFCQQPWTETQRRWACKNTFEWRPHAEFHGHRGFWISHLYSTLPVHSLQEMVLDWMNVKDDVNQVQVFKNTRLAELFSVEGERPEHEKIRERAEAYSIRGPNCILPEGVEGIVAGADVQARRIETQMLGFGMVGDLLHIWVVDYHVTELFEPDGTPKVTSSADYWKEQRSILNRTYVTPAGVRLPILAMCIDSAHQGEAVYQFALSCPRPTHGPKGIFIAEAKTVICIRGFDQEQYTPIHGVSDREAARMRTGSGRDLPIVTLGTGYLKTALYGALQSPESSLRLHFSQDLTGDYYKQLTAEQRIVTANRITYEKVYPRNEALDTFVYGMGAFYLIRADRWDPDEWDRYRQMVGLSKPNPKASIIRPYQSPYLGDE